MKLFVGIALFIIYYDAASALVPKHQDTLARQKDDDTAQITLPDGIVSKIRSAVDLNSVFKLLGIELPTRHVDGDDDVGKDKDDGDHSAEDDDDDSSSSRETDNSHYLSNPKEAACGLIDTLVELNPTRNSDLIVYPRCVKVKRCGGCCPDSNLECQPVSYNKVIVKVIEIQNEQSPARSKRAIRNVTIEEHTACGCSCQIKEEDCDINLQEYVRSFCYCRNRSLTVVPQIEKPDEINAAKRPFDCSEVCSGRKECKSGVYSIHPYSDGQSVSVFCDMETAGGGWTVLLRRMNQTSQEDFHEGWQAYKSGFGKAEGEYWIGNEVMHQMTSKKNYTLRIEATAENLEDAWGEFDKFKVYSENLNYRLQLEGPTVGNLVYNGSKGLERHNGVQFTTYDNDNDLSPGGNCGSLYGVGMWYHRCYNFNPTGKYGVRRNDGIKFEKWTQDHPVIAYADSLQMKIRPQIQFPDVPKIESSVVTAQGINSRPFDCSEVCSGQKECKSGVYSIHPLDGNEVHVFCDMETDGGGWTVLLMRMKQDPQQDFRDTWKGYKDGFGTAEGEYWIGNEVMHQMTALKNYTFRIEATADDQEDVWGEFAKFKIDSEDLRYRLKLEEPTVGNLVYNETGGLKMHNGQNFSTIDRDNDLSPWGSCAIKYGTGMWFGSCYNFLPTGKYGVRKPMGIRFEKWTKDYPVEVYANSLQMKIRPQIPSSDVLKIEETTELSESTGTKVIISPLPDIPKTDGSLGLSESTAPGTNNRPFDCSEICSNQMECKSGVYSIHLLTGKSVKVFCDMETEGGGWTILLRRMKQDPQEDFQDTWQAYRNGFGMAEGEYWIGNEIMHQMTTQKNYTLRIEATAEDQEDAWGEFAKFQIDSEDLKYRLKLEEPTVGNLVYNETGGLEMHNGQSFSTFDRDNDLSPWGSCGSKYGSGMWFGSCYNFLPTGRYGVHKPEGIRFEKWTKDYPVEVYANSLQMKIRPQK